MKNCQDECFKDSTFLCIFYLSLHEEKMTWNTLFCLFLLVIIYFAVATDLVGSPFADMIVLESSAAPAVQPGAVCKYIRE